MCQKLYPTSFTDAQWAIIEPLRERVPAQVHVVFCSRCRARLSQMERASRAIADTVRGRTLPRWALPFAGGAAAAAQITVAWLTALLVTAVFIVIVVTRAVHPPAKAPLPAAQAVPGGGCRPDLPTDQCR